MVELVTLLFDAPPIIPPCTPPESMTILGTITPVLTPVSTQPSSHDELSAAMESTLITSCGGFETASAGEISTSFSSSSIGMPPPLALVGVMVTEMVPVGGVSGGPLAGSDSLGGTTKEEFAFSPLSMIILVTVDDRVLLVCR